MKASRMREQTEDELRQLCAETRKEYGELRLKKGAGAQAQSPLRARTLRREIARILTVMRERGM
jgi:large subunit ribosomal protein L29